MRSMIAFLVVGAIALVSGAAVSEKLFFSSAYKWENLKITFGINPLKSFQSMPRTMPNKAGSNGWALVTHITNCTNGGTFNGFRYIHKGDKTMALLFDVNGVIAGIQMILNKGQLTSRNNPFHFDQVPMYQRETFEGEEVYTLTTYFVHPDTICTAGRTEADLKKEGTGSKLYFQNGPTPSDLVIPPTNRPDAIKEGWSKNECLPLMGWHNFYKVEEFAAKECLEIRPYFLLFNEKDQLKAFGFVAVGDAVSDRYEKPGPAPVKAIVGSTTPQCLLDLAENIKLSTMHVYFDNLPQLENCIRL